MIQTIRQLLTARQRDLADVELDLEKYYAKLVELRAERGEIIEDITGLERRLSEDD
jgi:F0F1-type ATP synthase membrane subunit b/b'